MTDKYFEPLVGLDTWFLYAERHEAPLHIGATYIFEGTPRVKGGRGALGLARTIEERLHLVPRYRQKLMWLPGNVGNPVWVDDPDFDLSYHVRRAALPSPGDEATLRDYTARVFARRWTILRGHLLRGLSMRASSTGTGGLRGARARCTPRAGTTAVSFGTDISATSATA